MQLWSNFLWIFADCVESMILGLPLATHCAQLQQQHKRTATAAGKSHSRVTIVHNYLLSNMNMMFKIFIAFAVLQLSSATLEEDEYALGVQLHQRAPIPGNLVPLPKVDASLGHLHLSVNSGTPGTWYAGKVCRFTIDSVHCN